MTSEPLPPRTIFFGYPSQPNSLREAVANGARRIGSLDNIIATTWEDLAVAGKVVIDEVLDSVDASSLVALEVGDLNANVLFELGFSIARNKHIWLLRDPSDATSNRRWGEFGLLSTVGYTAYTNSEEVFAGFRREQPLEQERTLFQRSVEPLLDPTATPSIFYLPSFYPTEVGRAVTDRILDERNRGLRYVAADASESGPQSMAWYGQAVYEAAATVVHLVESRREGSQLHNARAAFVAGLSLGFGKALVMIAEDEQLQPLDYRDLVLRCTSSKECSVALDAWLGRSLAAVYATLRRRAEGSSIRLATELRDLRLGEPVAENEERSLSAYFLETASFRQVLESRATVFVGRKGCGKTANLLQAAERLRSDKRNLVCVVKPVWYEWESLLQLLEEYERRDAKGYVVQSLWKLLLYSEIASNAAESIERRSRASRSIDEQTFMEFIEGPGFFVRQDFGVRLEGAISALLQVPQGLGLGEQRLAISEAVHDRPLKDLRQHLGRILKDRQRVAILVDNLDKGWESEADLAPLGSFLLGLLTTVAEVSDEFSRSDAWREAVNVTITVFLRSDIYSHVVRVAPEPDKIPLSRVRWANDEMLRRVVEERFIAARGGKESGVELWTQFFAPTTRGVDTADYLLTRVMPRPRDLIVWCSGAIERAINNGHSRVEEKDVLEAEEEYSRYAFEALQAEDINERRPIGDILYEFVGESAVISETDARAAVERSGATPDELDATLRRLTYLGFLGLETRPGVFAYADDDEERRRDVGLSRRLATRAHRERRFQIHAAFHSFLGIEPTEPSAAVE